MHKTSRLVIMIEPQLLNKAKKMAKQSAETLSKFVRDSLIQRILDHNATMKTKKLLKLGSLGMSLDGIDRIENLNRQIDSQY